MRFRYLPTPTATVPAVPWRIPLAVSTPAALTGLTLVAFALRLLLVDAFVLREDEAIYGVWARTVWRDPWFLSTWPDKPPLFLWLQAVSLALFGPSAAAVRMVSIAASTLTVPITALIARRLWGKRAAVMAGLLLALNPFAISFGPTGYTDSLLVLFGMASLCCALLGRPAWAGFWLGAAIMTKQQGVLYAPLILACIFLWPSGSNQQARSSISAIAWALSGLAAIIIPVMAWDAARWASAPSPWDLGVRNYGALALAAADDWWPRLLAWAQIAWHLTASWPVWVIFAALAVSRFVKMRPMRLTPAGLMVLWSLAFIFVHVFTTLPPWDRYLLPLAPFLALAGGWAAAQHLHLSAARGFTLLAVVGLLLLPPAVAASRGALPIGGDHGDLNGLDDALAWVRNAQPGEKTLYHQVIGWQAQYYLFDQVQAGAITLRWFPHAVYLADNAAKTPHLRKFLVEPDWAATSQLPFHLATRGIGLTEKTRVGRFVVYELTQPPQPACLWCASRAPGGWPWMAAPENWSAARP